MNGIMGFAALVVATVLCANSVAAAAWTPPIGIPMPPFGIDEVAPLRPSRWTTPTAGFYYVDGSALNATDSGNIYGTPGLPRKTVPTRLPAGSLVELHGVYTFDHSSPRDIVASGTAARPVFIRGVGATAKPIWTQRFIISGSYYIVENIDFVIAGEAVTVSYPTTRGVMRNNVMRGTATSRSGLAIASYSASLPIDNVVVYGNIIRDHAVWTNNAGDTDAHGIVVGEFVSYLWVLENELSYNEGTGIQINGGTANQASVHHIFVGRNVAHHNKQAGFSTKQSVDTIFSENTAYAHRASNSSDGSGLGQQYGPERVWYLFNHVYDCENGITAASDSGLGFGTKSYFIGNVVHNIHTSAAYFRANSPWSYGTGIQLVSHTDRVIINNTIYDVDNGITGAANGNRGSFAIVNNIIGKVTHPEGSHVFLEDSSVAAASSIHHNLLEGAVRIKWGGSTTYNITGFRAAFPGKGLKSLNANPLFLDAPKGDFRLQAASPAVGAGVIDGVFATFFALYGIEIRKDIVSLPRLIGSAVDIGAYGSGRASSREKLPRPATNLPAR